MHFEFDNLIIVHVSSSSVVIVVVDVTFVAVTPKVRWKPTCFRLPVSHLPALSPRLCCHRQLRHYRYCPIIIDIISSTSVCRRHRLRSSHRLNHRHPQTSSTLWRISAQVSRSNTLKMSSLGSTIARTMFSNFNLVFINCCNRFSYAPPIISSSPRSYPVALVPPGATAAVIPALSVRRRRRLSSYSSVDGGLRSAITLGGGI